MLIVVALVGCIFLAMAGLSLIAYLVGQMKKFIALPKKKLFLELLLTLKKVAKSQKTYVLGSVFLLVLAILAFIGYNIGGMTCAVTFVLHVLVLLIGVTLLGALMWRLSFLDGKFERWQFIFICVVVGTIFCYGLDFTYEFVSYDSTADVPPSFWGTMHQLFLSALGL